MITTPASFLDDENRHDEHHRDRTAVLRVVGALVSATSPSPVVVADPMTIKPTLAERTRTTGHHGRVTSPVVRLVHTQAEQSRTVRWRGECAAGLSIRPGAPAGVGPPVRLDPDPRTDPLTTQQARSAPDDGRGGCRDKPHPGGFPVGKKAQRLNPGRRGGARGCA